MTAPTVTTGTTFVTPTGDRFAESMSASYMPTGSFSHEHTTQVGTTRKRVVSK